MKKPYTEIRDTGTRRGLGVYWVGCREDPELYAPEGTVVAFGFVRDLLTHRTAETIEFDHGHHLLFTGPINVANHSCGPNCGLVILPSTEDAPLTAQLVALTTIDPGDELTWDYATHESYSIAVTHCLCGAPRCRGTSGGWETLRHDQQAALIRHNLVPERHQRTLKPKPTNQKTTSLHTHAHLQAP